MAICSTKAWLHGAIELEDTIFGLAKVRLCAWADGKTFLAKVKLQTGSSVPALNAKQKENSELTVLCEQRFQSQFFSASLRFVPGCCVND